MDASTETTDSIQVSRFNKTNNYYCCVPLCYSNGRYDNQISFHKFPKDDEMRKKWIVKIRRDVGPDFQISKNTAVCSKHFVKEDYTGYTPLRRKLKTCAIPTVFSWAEEKPQRRALKRTLISPTDAKSKRLKCETITSSEEPQASDEILTAVPLYVVQQQEIDNLKQQLAKEREEYAALTRQLEMERFLVSRFAKDDKMILFYTGFSTYTMFTTFYKCIESSAKNMLSKYYEPGQTLGLKGRKRNMLLIDEFFMFLCRLRVGLIETDLSVRFNCSVPTVSRKIVTWANFLYLSLARIPIWLSKEQVNANMPQCFKEVYPKTRVIIDCTEIKTQQPSSLVLNSQFYSNYKSACTLKCLLGISPHGAVTFISTLFTGSMSDVEITKLSGLLDLLEPGDDVMADKGFTIKNILQEKQVTLNIPPFLSSKKQFSKHEIKETEQIAKLRIHIERVNRRIKEYHLFDVPVPMTLIGTVNQLWTVACMLSNFKGPIVTAWSLE